MSALKLGAKLKSDVRTLLIADVLKPELPAIPDYFIVDDLLGVNIDNPPYGNDVISNCVIAGQAHWMRRANYPDVGQVLAITTAEVKREYYLQCGWSGWCWDPTGQYDDDGLVVLDSLKKFRNTGWRSGKAIHKIKAFGMVNWLDYSLLKACIYLFSGCYAAVGLPNSAAVEFDQGMTWRELSNPVAGWGYHCMVLNGVVKDGSTPLLEWLTWGKRQYSTLEWGLRYLSEAYALVDDPDNPQSGIDTDKLEAYLESIK